MKKILLLSFLSLVICLVFIIQALAQDSKKDKISLQITRDGKVVTDTTFQLKEGQDPEAVKKIISHVLEGDIKIISAKEGHQKIVWVTSEDPQHVWHAEDVDIDLDTVIEKEKHVMVYKEKEGEGHHKVVIKKGTVEGETVIIESGDSIEISEEEGEGSKIIIIKEKGDEGCEGKQKHVKVIVEGDEDVRVIGEDDLEWIEEEDAENVDVYIIKKDDGSTKIVKKVKVEVQVDEENDNENEQPAQPEQPPQPEKEKKKEK